MTAIRSEAHLGIEFKAVGDDFADRRICGTYTRV